MKPFLNLGFVVLPTFYVVQSLALVLCLWFISKRIDAAKNYDRKTAFDLCIVLMVSALVGSRLFHILYESPTYYMRYPEQIFQLWNGGYVYFGGMLLAILSGWLFLRYKKQHFLIWADFMAPAVSLLYALGRLGCFFEGCCYGKYCDLPWAIQQKHPTQLYMTLAELVTFYIIVQMKPNVRVGKIFFTWLYLHSASRFIIEFFRDDDRGALIGNFTVSQVISLLIFIVSIYFLNHHKFKNK